VNVISVKIKFLGGAREVGRIAISVKTEKTQLLLDYGVLFGHEPGFPMHVPPKEIDGVILTHAHLDHSGTIPIFQIREKKPVYGTQPTFDITELLISDFIHLSGYYLPFEYLELRSTMNSCVHLNYREKRVIGDITFQLLNAGHIPGSSQVLLETNGKRLLYTGDYNTSKTRLLSGADIDYGELDAVIIESTYSEVNHAERATLEKDFVKSVVEVIESGGTVLVPAFSVGRSQEIACILAAYNLGCPITMDGMARKVNRILMRHTTNLQNPRLFMEAMNTITWVEGWRDRRNALKKSGVIISPAGMLRGGPAAYYIQRLGKKQGNAVFLVSYQIPGTPGRELLETGRCVIDGKLRKIKAQVKHFDFSSHCGADQLRDTIKKLEGNPKLYAVHGAEGSCSSFAKWIKNEAELDAVAPTTGDAYAV
jgi:putative mRNA 3-end processing factor